MTISTPAKMIALAGGTIVSSLIFLSVWRTHLLARNALDRLKKSNHPWAEISRATVPLFLDFHANAYLVVGTGLITLVFLVLTVVASVAWFGTPC